MHTKQIQLESAFNQSQYWNESGVTMLLEVLLWGTGTDF
jgi:hypothetical protein